MRSSIPRPTRMFIVLAGACLWTNATLASENVSTITELWQKKTTPSDWSGLFGAPAISEEGVIFFGSTDGFVYAFTSDGSTKWKYDTKKGITGDVAIDPK